MAKISEIADASGVSPMTVSRVLRGVGRVAPQTREHVRTVAENLGVSSRDHVAFTPPIRRGHSDHSLRVLWPQLSDLELAPTPLNRLFIEGIEQGIHRSRGRLSTARVDGFSGIEEAIAEHRPSGLVFRQPIPEAWLKQLRTRLPVTYACSIDQQEGVDCVFTNEFRAAARVFNELAGRGHGPIAWFGLLDDHDPLRAWARGLDDTTPADRLAMSSIHATRYAAWSNFVIGQGEAPRDTLLIRRRDHHSASLDDAVEAGIDALLGDEPQPTAIVTPTVCMAEAVIHALSKCGLSVPGDVSVVAYGCRAEAESCRRHIATLEVPLRTIGRTVPEMIQRRLADPHGAALTLQIEGGWFAGQSLADARRFGRTTSPLTSPSRNSPAFQGTGGTRCSTPTPPSAPMPDRQ